MLEKMSGTHSHRIPPKYFSDQSIDVREAFTVSVSREPFVTNDRINFSLSLLLDIREQRHGQEERVYRGDRLRIRRLSAEIPRLVRVLYRPYQLLHLYTKVVSVCEQRETQGIPQTVERSGRPFDYVLLLWGELLRI